MSTKIFDLNLVLTNQTLLSLVLIDTAVTKTTRMEERIEKGIVHKKS